MRDDRRWQAALAEHDAALRMLRDAAASESGWTDEPAPGKWSVAAVLLHVAMAYEVARETVTGGIGMRMRVSTAKARLLRAIVLPVILFVDRFPRDVTAPREVRPDLAEARTTSRADAKARLERAAAAAATTLRDAPADATLRHAYFGALTPYQAIRMLSAHTRHHARLLRSAASRG